MLKICGTCAHYRGGYKSRICSHPRLKDYADFFPYAVVGVTVKQTRPDEAEDECEFWERRPDNREYEPEVA